MWAPLSGPVRREWDLNPRCPKDTTVFETVRFGRSRIPPRQLRAYTRPGPPAEPSNPVGEPMGSDRPLSQFPDSWLEFTGPDRSLTTIRGYRDKVRRWKAVLGKKEVSKLTAQDLDRAYARWLEEGAAPVAVTEPPIAGCAGGPTGDVSGGALVLRQRRR